MILGANILVVDDDFVFRERLARAFADRGYSVATAGSGAEMRERVDQSVPTHAIVDLRLVDESGLELIDELAIGRGCRVLMLTGYGSVATALDAVRRGAANYLAKPVGFTELESALFGPPLTPPARTSFASVPSLDEVEWEHIQRVLHDCGGNITRAAKLLGMHRQALQRKLRSR